ncbi:MAG: HPF/RaiA family ribosome-associated protein [Planctomycetia bacterium]|nr:HPF/RaiA family ribosome-associated protein [Planctomycetia bacterium]
MQIPLQVSFRHMEHSDDIEDLIRDKAAKLESYSDRIMGCRVVVQPVGKHHQHGNQYEVRIDLTLPGGEIAITREPSEHTEHKELQVAIRDAFDSARRRLQDHLRCQEGAVKVLQTSPHARVSALVRDQDFGFLTTVDGREIYFHRHSVLNDKFDELQIGTEVTYVEQEGEKGPQASTVRLVGKHHHV